MTDTEKMYAYEMQRRQTIGNYLNRINNLGYGNAAGTPFNVDYDDKYSIEDNEDNDNEDNEVTMAPSPKSVQAPTPETTEPDLEINPSEEDPVAPEATEEPTEEDPDLEINPSEEDPVEDPFKDFEG